MTRDDGFLTRWSERKRAQEAPEAEVEVPPEQDPLEGLSDEEILAQLDLPEPESITAGEGARAFLASTVPHHLRHRALRTLWRTNPTLANVDALVDYGEDFTDAAMVPEVLSTAYQVGKGILKQIAEPVTEVEARETPITPEVSDVEEPEEETPIESVEIAAAPQLQDAPQRSLRPRRMRFTYDG